MIKVLSIQDGLKIANELHVCAIKNYQEGKFREAEGNVKEIINISASFRFENREKLDNIAKETFNLVK